MSQCSNMMLEIQRWLRKTAQSMHNPICPFGMALMNVYPVDFEVNSFFRLISHFGMRPALEGALRCKLCIINYLVDLSVLRYSRLADR
jgi:hypothetical protein